MKPEAKSETLLKITRAKAKMIEYSVPEEYQKIDLKTDPASLLRLAIGILGDTAARVSLNNDAGKVFAESQGALAFSSRFFDSYLQSQLNVEIDPYIALLGASAYYLGDVPGSARVLAGKIDANDLNLGADGLECLLLWLLNGDPLAQYEFVSDGYGEAIFSISQRASDYFKSGGQIDGLLSACDTLVDKAFKFGTPREFLFSELIGSLVRKKIENSSWRSLPLYSEIAVEKWRAALEKESFVRELWPAQHLLGKNDILKGISAVIQMPTSAGKTKATEIIIRSAFLSERATLAVIVAPFRALCHEIRNAYVSAFAGEDVTVREFTDVQQDDFILEEIFGGQSIVVVTPEKILYVLRHSPELAEKIGLVIFDEGHQFDNGKRGITYELLLTALRAALAPGTQKILISAVISNARIVADWICGDGSKVVDGASLLPTSRSIGFASWMDKLGQIGYRTPTNIDLDEGFVPRVIESRLLKKLPEDKKAMKFPSAPEHQTSGREVAIYLGLKLVRQGAIAVFCGKKETASKLAEIVGGIYRRGLDIPPPSTFSDSDEMVKMTNIIVANLGSNSAAAAASSVGVFLHHGNVPHGIRLATEEAMREGKIRFVICTSTLAQGVNLPIRYLIVTTTYQAGEEIRVRDFHNLIGRAGRSGMHTEGSILFSDAKVFDQRHSLKERWRWGRVKKLLDPNQSEACGSSLMALLPVSVENSRFKSKDGKAHIQEVAALVFAEAYVSGGDAMAGIARTIDVMNKGKGFLEAETIKQLDKCASILASVESFIMSQLEDWEGEDLAEKLGGLAEGTLAYHMASEEQKVQLKELFVYLGKNVNEELGALKSAGTLGKTLYGVHDIKMIESWFVENHGSIVDADDDDEILDAIWPLLTKVLTSKLFHGSSKPDALRELVRNWISGMPYYKIYHALQKTGCRRKWGTKFTDYDLDNVVEMCENALGFDGALLLGALAGISDMLEIDGTEELGDVLKRFQKRLKYGLPDDVAVTLFELGFSDRVIAMEIYEKVRIRFVSRKRVMKELERAHDAVMDILSKYPTFFTDRLADMSS